MRDRFSVSIKRVYDFASPDDGYRILVDRLWPRGISKDKAQIDEWSKIIAPSTELRKWFDHRADRWAEFRARYRGELVEPESDQEVERLAEIALKQGLTLVYAARNETENHAIVLCEVLRERCSSSKN